MATETRMQEESEVETFAFQAEFLPSLIVETVNFMPFSYFYRSIICDNHIYNYFFFHYRKNIVNICHIQN